MEKIKRYIIFLIGLFINSLGVSLITKANLGTSPISSIPYVLSLSFPFTLGNFTIVFSLLLIFLQLLMLRKNFKPEHFLQIPVSILFGYFIDVTMVMLAFVSPATYIAKVIYLLIGCLILGFGVYIEVLADVVMLPGESFVRAVVYLFKTEFGITKICFDVSMTVIAGVLSFVFAGKLDGVREGTIIAALLVGYIARLFGRKLAFVKEKLFKEEKIAIPQMSASALPVIVIGRQYSCGGHEIGEKLAQKLSFKFYDKNIIKLTAGSTGYTPAFIQKKEENMQSTILYDLLNQMYAYAPKETAPKDNIFEAETKVITDIANEGNCVIIGRCSDYILRNNKNCLKVFLQAPREHRIQRLMEKENLSLKDAILRVNNEDKKRADNYYYYTHQIWGNSANYHITLDTSLGEDFVIDSIIRALKQI